MVKFRMVDRNNKERLEKKLSTFSMDDNILLHNIRTILRVDGRTYELEDYKNLLCSSDGGQILLINGRDSEQVSEELSSFGVSFQEVTLFQDVDSELPFFPKLEKFSFAGDYEDIGEESCSYIPIDGSISMHYDTSNGEDKLIYVEYLNAALQKKNSISFASSRLDSEILFQESKNITLDTNARVLKLMK